MLFKTGVHALARFHAFEQGVHIFFKGLIFMKIISSYNWGVHALENLNPNINVLPSHLMCGQLVTAREQ